MGTRSIRSIWASVGSRDADQQRALLTEVKIQRDMRRACCTEKSVVVRLRGGTGNQLFQWAAGRALAERNRVPLWVDTSTGFAGDEYRRQFALTEFCFTGTILPGRKALDVWRWRGITDRSFPLMEKLFRRATGRNFWPCIVNCRVTSLRVLDGYFQSPLYFQGFEDLIRNELRFKYDHAVDSGLQELIESTDSVGVHVRRLHGVPTGAIERHGLGYGYYARACSRLVQGLRKPHMFVFGDKPEWLLAGYSPLCPVTVVTGNYTKNDIGDLCLMAKCKHHIISNSTFAWWGAWLGRQEGQRVIAPDIFSPNLRWRYRDVYPTEWEQIAAIPS